MQTQAISQQVSEYSYSSTLQAILAVAFCIGFALVLSSVLPEGHCPTTPLDISDINQQCSDSEAAIKQIESQRYGSGI